jgi:hypothetical protein
MRCNDDSLTQIAWLKDKQGPNDLLVTKTKFTIGTTEYWTTVLWNAEALVATVRRLPLFLFIFFYT